LFHHFRVYADDVGSAGLQGANVKDAQPASDGRHPLALEAVGVFCGITMCDDRAMGRLSRAYTAVAAAGAVGS